MQVEIKIDSSCKEPKIIVVTDKITDEINMLIKNLSYTNNQVIAGFKDDTVELLQQDDILRVYSLDKNIYALTANGKYRLRMRLYEIEEKLDKSKFVRISNSEIINLHKVKNFDLSFTGTICVCLCDNSNTYVSRRYVSKIKQVLGI